MHMVDTPHSATIFQIGRMCRGAQDVLGWDIPEASHSIWGVRMWSRCPIGSLPFGGCSEKGVRIAG